MKAVFGAVVIVATLVVMGYKLGAFHMEDSAVQYQNMKEAVKEGMSWTEVADIKEPKKFAKYSSDPLKGRLPPQDFDRDLIAKWHKDGNMPFGFIYRYAFGPEHVLEVRFNGEGLCEGTRDGFTAGDILQTKKRRD